MFQQVIDFRDESDALYTLLKPLSDEGFLQRTQFKQWTINDIIGHLHIWNRAADLSLRNPKAFQEFLSEVMTFVRKGQLRTFEQNWLDGLRGCALCDNWHDSYLEMCQHFGEADPKARVAWAGPDMSVLSSITARLMETWAHGQAIYDLLGMKRVDEDRIKNIAVLGVKTFGWTFKNRGLPVPGAPPHLRLNAPSGQVWKFNEPNETDSIEGNASEFCQVVTQVRNIEDTSLTVNGDAATQWMAIAQCFAGPPEDPPTLGSRFTNAT